METIYCPHPEMAYPDTYCISRNQKPGALVVPVIRIVPILNGLYYNVKIVANKVKFVVTKCTNTFMSSLKLKRDICRIQ